MFLLAPLKFGGYSLHQNTSLVFSQAEPVLELVIPYLSLHSSWDHYPKDVFCCDLCCMFSCCWSVTFPRRQHISELSFPVSGDNHPRKAGFSQALGMVPGPFSLDAHTGSPPPLQLQKSPWTKTVEAWPLLTCQ